MYTSAFNILSSSMVILPIRSRVVLKQVCHLHSWWARALCHHWAYWSAYLDHAAREETRHSWANHKAGTSDCSARPSRETMLMGTENAVNSLAARKLLAWNLLARRDDLLAPDYRTRLLSGPVLSRPGRILDWGLGNMDCASLVRSDILPVWSRAYSVNMKFISYTTYQPLQQVNCYQQ